MEDKLQLDLYKINSFFQDGSINPTLISNLGENNVEKLIEYLLTYVEVKYYDEKKKQDKTIRNKALTVNQLRKFYDSFLKIYHALLNEKEKKILLLMLKANAEYSSKRLETIRFNIVFSNRINLVVSKEGDEFIKNLDAFKLHFEAIVAYFPKN